MLVIAVGVVLFATAALSGRTSLLIMGVAAGIAAGINLGSQVISNIKNKKDWFEDIDWISVGFSALSRAALVTGAGGIIGSFALGALSGAAQEALNDGGVSRILLGGFIGGLAAGGHGVKTATNNFLYGIKKGLGNTKDVLSFKNIYDMAKVDGCGMINRITVAFDGSFATFLPALFKSASRGVLNVFKKEGLKWI